MDLYNGRIEILCEVACGPPTRLRGLRAASGGRRRDREPRVRVGSRPGDDARTRADGPGLGQDERHLRDIRRRRPQPGRDDRPRDPRRSRTAASRPVETPVARGRSNHLGSISTSTSETSRTGSTISTSTSETSRTGSTTSSSRALAGPRRGTRSGRSTSSRRSTRRRSTTPATTTSTTRRPVRPPSRTSRSSRSSRFTSRASALGSHSASITTVTSTTPPALVDGDDERLTPVCSL